MAPDIETPFGHAIPPFPVHSITMHMPKWATILQFVESPPSVVSRMKSLYPRLAPFGPVKELAGRIASDCLQEGQTCLLFATKDSAEACRDFVLSENRNGDRCEPCEVSIQAYDFRFRVWAVSLPATKVPATKLFWQDSGTGISYRLAESCLNRYDSRKRVECIASRDEGLRDCEEIQPYKTIQDRIANLLNRAPVAQHPASVKANDVFLYPTGMTAIYRLHRYLQHSSIRPGTTVLFGFAFNSTPRIYKEYSSNFKWFGRGDEEETSQLEEFCATEADAGRQVQAVWLEWPSNPNIRTADLNRLRTLADKYNFYLIVDDTLASFCNVDLLEVADVLVTSLTKSFSGYADVMGGSVVLNPNSKHYGQLMDLCRNHFINELWGGDVEALELNSRDYLERSERLNDNALAVVEYLHSLVEDASSAVSGVAYPSVGPGAEFYRSFMRPDTAEFTTGYGCLFSIELDSIESTVAFYDALHVHNGPHLGANLTLALPYVKTLHSKEISWLEECGMNERMVRISAGIEETEDLVNRFKTAVQAADAVKRKDPLNDLANSLD